MPTWATVCPSTGASTTRAAGITSQPWRATCWWMTSTGRWRSVHEADGLIWGHSAVLGLDLCWDAGDLRFRDPVSAEFLLMPEDERAARLERERRLEVESVRAERAELERDQEAAARQVAEAEVGRLRELLGESGGTE